MWGKRAETYLESDNSGIFTDISINKSINDTVSLDSSEKVKKEWNKSR